MEVKARLIKIMEGTNYVKKKEEKNQKCTVIKYTAIETEVKKVDFKRKNAEATNHFDEPSIVKNREEQYFKENIEPNFIEDDKYSLLDFSSGSSDDYIPNSESNTSTDSFPKKTKKITYMTNTFVPESPESFEEKHDSDIITTTKSVENIYNSLADQPKTKTSKRLMLLNDLQEMNLLVYWS